MLFFSSKTKTLNTQLDRYFVNTKTLSPIKERTKGGLVSTDIVVDLDISFDMRT